MIHQEQNPVAFMENGAFSGSETNIPPLWRMLTALSMWCGRQYISFRYWLLFKLEPSIPFIWILASDLFGRRLPLYLGTCFYFIFNPVSKIVVIPPFNSFGCRFPKHLEPGLRFNLDAGFHIFQILLWGQKTFGHPSLELVTGEATEFF